MDGHRNSERKTNHPADSDVTISERRRFRAVSPLQCGSEMRRESDLELSLVNAIGLCLVGALALLLRPSSRSFGLGSFGYAAVWVVDIILGARGTQESTRRRVRIALGISVGLIACLVWLSRRW